MGVRASLNKGKYVISAALSCTLIACSHNSPAPVYDLYSSDSNQRIYQARNTNLTGNEYTVKPGDTLFSIAWYHSLDHRELANINRIKNNTIFPGQKLKLKITLEESYFNAESLIAALNQEVLKRPVSISRSNKIASASKSISRSKPKTTKISIQRSPQKAKKVALKTPKASSKKTSYRTKVNRSKNHSYQLSKLNWIWPTDGKILERFSSNTNANRGLDIAGKRGQPVRATAPGQVVYKGSGLRGYGNLVIIKHNNDYLSAYAHNEKVHVTENEFVTAGQRIADIGRSGAQRDKLHFEIRYKGKPVDPLNYLPQKKF